MWVFVPPHASSWEPICSGLVNGTRHFAGKFSHGKVPTTAAEIRVTCARKEGWSWPLSMVKTILSETHGFHLWPQLWHWASKALGKSKTWLMSLCYFARAPAAVSFHHGVCWVEWVLESSDENGAVQCFHCLPGLLFLYPYWFNICHRITKVWEGL